MTTKKMPSKKKADRVGKTKSPHRSLAAPTILPVSSDDVSPTENVPGHQEDKSVIKPLMPLRPYLVGIGSSAGGLEALSTLIAALPTDLGISYVVLQHLSPTHRSMMVQLLGRETAMAVQEAEPLRINATCFWSP